MALGCAILVKTIFWERRKSRDIPEAPGEVLPLHLLDDGAAHLPADLVWVPSHLPLAMALCKCQVPVVKGVGICAQIAKTGVNTVLLPLSLPP